MSTDEALAQPKKMTDEELQAEKYIALKKNARELSEMVKPIFERFPEAVVLVATPQGVIDRWNGNILNLVAAMELSKFQMLRVLTSNNNV